MRRHRFAVQSWEGSVGLTMWPTSTGEVRVSLSVETGSTSNPHRELWDRPLAELLEGCKP